MRRRLVIDDLRVLAEVDGVETVYARTLPEAMVAIETARDDGEMFDEVWFDHDLGEYDDGTVMESRPAALLLVEVAHLQGRLLTNATYVITDNITGRDWLVGTLSRYFPCRYVPAGHVRVATLDPPTVRPPRPGR